MPFAPQQYGPFAPLLEMAPTVSFFPQKHPESSVEVIEAVANSPAVKAAANRQLAQCCLAGMWLRYGHLEDSHQISQQISSAEGSFWHGLMHRHEGDFSNSNYWFRQTGKHAVFADLAAAARVKPGGEAFLDASGRWDAYAFTEGCEREVRLASPGICSTLAQVEWNLLFDYCYRRGFGG